MNYLYLDAHQAAIDDENDTSSRKDWRNFNPGLIWDKSSFILKK